MPQEKQADQKMGANSGEQISEYDFSRCKLCAANTARPKYTLKNTTVYACDACDFHFINHLDSLPSETPSDAAIPLDRKALDYIEGRLPDSEKQLRKNLLLVKRHLSLSGAHCLDIGAGAGLFAHLLAEAGAVVHGIEPQSIFRQFAQRKFGIALKRETIDARYWQQGFSGFFDVVTLWDVFEHVNFPAETLQNAYDVIKPGGWLFLDTPRRNALYYRISEWSYRLSNGENPLFLESLYSPLPFRHKQLFTQRQLLKLVEKTGFSVVHMQSSLLRQHNKMVIVCRKQ
ncbi:MAG: class I SAM-dependent methyltransferase [Desulfuromonadales bacterium]|nr:class I SAM-dependent methyltransferase [Desulfuromonadales bacterium]